MESIKSLALYIFDRNPGSVYGYYTLSIILIIALIAFSIGFSHYYKLRKKEDQAFKKLFPDLAKTSLKMGLLLAAEIFFRYETIPYFSMRIWLYLTLGYLAYLIYAYVQKYRVSYPQEKLNYTTKVVHTEKKSYLPNKSKK
ncbi:hypothetical protein COU74_04175 [Candidatus Peregrinibacteria bacterium CG10_big_fil_rev_8_21_14_0_10_36_19]|nr:MAG: hypothetical protein COU74_04175 [Candidatus Peregrinibacteria bacterium CG10_big_fil_rev_8_21_14_0_10_36_19]